MCLTSLLHQSDNFIVSDIVERLLIANETGYDICPEGVLSSCDLSWNLVCYSNLQKDVRSLISPSIIPASVTETMQTIVFMQYVRDWLIHP